MSATRRYNEGRLAGACPLLSARDGAEAQLRLHPRGMQWALLRLCILSPARI